MATNLKSWEVTYTDGTSEVVQAESRTTSTNGLLWQYVVLGDTYREIVIGNVRGSRKVYEAGTALAKETDGI
jgi:hypothetical protein